MPRAGSVWHDVLMKVRLCAVVCCLGMVAACGGSDDGGGSSDNTGGGAGGGGATGGSGGSGAGGGGSKPSPGKSADGWQSAYEKGSVGSNCDASADELLSSGMPSLTVGDTTLLVGYHQKGNNQNPIVARVDAGETVYCTYHETEGPDGRAESITWDGGDVAYVTYTIVGGGSSLEGKGGWLSSYAPGAISGGGPKVSVVGRVDVPTGALDTSTFIIAVKSDNKVNSHGPAGPVTMLEDGNVEFLGGSAHKPIDADGKSAMDCTDYPFDSRYIFSPDLKTLVCAECTNCTSQKPCE